MWIAASLSCNAGRFDDDALNEALPPLRDVDRGDRRGDGAVSGRPSKVGADGSARRARAHCREDRTDARAGRRSNACASRAGGGATEAASRGATQAGVCDAIGSDGTKVGVHTNEQARGSDASEQARGSNTNEQPGGNEHAGRGLRHETTGRGHEAVDGGAGGGPRRDAGRAGRGDQGPPAKDGGRSRTGRVGGDGTGHRPGDGGRVGSGDDKRGASVAGTRAGSTGRACEAPAGAAGQRAESPGGGGGATRRAGCEGASCAARRTRTRDTDGSRAR